MITIKELATGIIRIKGDNGLSFKWASVRIIFWLVIMGIVKKKTNICFFHHEFADPAIRFLKGF